MGTWGTGPFDSDTAADLMGGIEAATTESNRLSVATSAVLTLLKTEVSELEDISKYSDHHIDEGVAASAFLTDVARWNLGRGGGWKSGYRKWTNTPYADGVDFNDVAKPTHDQVGAALKAVQKVSGYIVSRYGHLSPEDVDLDDYTAMLKALESDLVDIFSAYDD